MNRLARYRAAENALFVDAGLKGVKEHGLDLRRLGKRVRVLECGQGQPLLFLHGGPNAAATWAQVVARLSGFRCLLLDRPGTGLSEPPQKIPGARDLPGYVAELTADVLDALGLRQVSIVGSSLGGYSALRSAIALPKRVNSIVLTGCPAFVPGWTAPAFFSLLRTPLLGRCLLALPPTAASVRMSLRQMGHASSLEDEGISEPMQAWIRAWMRDTPTMRNDARMIVNCGTWLGGFDPALDLRPDELAQTQCPVLALFGGSDPVGGEAVGHRLCSMLPDARLIVWPDSGHLPWLDRPDEAAAEISAFATENRS